MAHKILLIGPDAPLRASRQHLLQRAGYVVKTATDHTALERLEEDGFEMVVLGPSIPETGYSQLEDRLRKAHPQAFIVKIQVWSAHRGKAPNAFVDNWNARRIARSDTDTFQSYARADCGSDSAPQDGSRRLELVGLCSTVLGLQSSDLRG